MSKAKICDQCGDFIYLQWSDHCKGYSEFVDKDGLNFGDQNIERGEGGSVGCDSYETYICNGCGKEFDDLDNLEVKEVKESQCKSQKKQVLNDLDSIKKIINSLGILCVKDQIKINDALLKINSIEETVSR